MENVQICLLLIQHQQQQQQQKGPQRRAETQKSHKVTQTTPGQLLSSMSNK